MVVPLFAHLKLLTEAPPTARLRTPRFESTTKDPAEWGDVYSFLGIDSTAKIVISFHVGKRDRASTDAFIGDLRVRFRVVPYITPIAGTPMFQPSANRSQAARTSARW